MRRLRTRENKTPPSTLTSANGPKPTSPKTSGSTTGLPTRWPKPSPSTPSKGSDAHRGDYSAFISLAVDPDGILYVQADMARRPTPQMVADGVELYRQFKPHIFGVEANQFQELLAPEFQAQFRRQGLLDVHPWLINNDANKRVRIRRLGPLLAGRRIRFKANCPSTQDPRPPAPGIPHRPTRRRPRRLGNGTPPRHRTTGRPPKRRRPRETDSP